MLQLCLLVICVIIFSCDENSTDSTQKSTGKLVITSIPSGARIFLGNNDTGKDTPDTLYNLEAGNYDLFLYLQYYDTAFFSVTIFDDLTTTKNVILEDGLPFVEFIWDYSIAFTGDSVRFFFKLNQDVLIDSIIVERPVDGTGNYLTEKYFYNNELFIWKDQSGNQLKYYLPPPGSGKLYYPRVQHYGYRFYVFGQKAYGAKVSFYISAVMDV